MDDFIYRAIVAAIGVSVIAGSLGCFVIWKRLSYFSDSISHSALLGEENPKNLTSRLRNKTF